MLAGLDGTGTAGSHDKARPVQSHAGETIVSVDGIGKGQFRSGPL